MKMIVAVRPPAEEKRKKFMPYATALEDPMEKCEREQEIQRKAAQGLTLPVDYSASESGEAAEDSGKASQGE